MKKYLQYAKAYVISQHFTYDEEYFNSIDVEAQFIGLSDSSFQSISFMLRNKVFTKEPGSLLENLHPPILTAFLKHC